MSLKVFRNKYSNIHIKGDGHEVVATKKGCHYKTGINSVDNNILFHLSLQEFLHNEKLNEETISEIDYYNSLQEANVYTETEIKYCSVKVDVMISNDFIMAYN